MAFPQIVTNYKHQHQCLHSRQNLGDNWLFSFIIVYKITPKSNLAYTDAEAICYLNSDLKLNTTTGQLTDC